MSKELELMKATLRNIHGKHVFNEAYDRAVKELKDYDDIDIDELAAKLKAIYDERISGR